MPKKSQEIPKSQQTSGEEALKRPSGIVHAMPSPCGRPLKFSKAEKLWEKFVEYCDYVDGNPWQVKSASNSIDSRSGTNVNALRQEVRPVQRAYTLYGFCAFAGIHYKWADFRKNYYPKSDDFKRVIDTIENVICAQQVDGAMINQFNSGLVARLNGIADKQITELTGKDGEEFKFPSLSAADIDELKRLNGF